MKYSGLIIALIFPICGAEKINWGFGEPLDWKFKSANQSVKQEPQTARKEVPPNLHKSNVVTPYIIERYVEPEIIYTKPRYIRYYRTTEYLCKPCK
jgi:hypothetical protein